jgi:thioester reductase-like protein
MTDTVVSPHGFDLDARATLDPAIVPLGDPVDLSAEPNAIYLTGVTGFVGAFLLRELLDSTNATIYCLVRARSEENAVDRIRENLQEYHLWNDAFVQRIVPIVGDLKLPRFGVSDETWQRLSETIDVIYHCGSKLSYVAPYEYLSAANVGGTQEVLRLATLVKTKPVHYVSSLGILLAYQVPEGGGEDDELDQTKCPVVGYFQTKYVSEKVVRIARSRGIPVTIHRIGLIVGDSRTGVSNVDDFVARMIIGCIQAGFSPNIHKAMDMTPVDYVSRAIVYLSRRQSSLGKLFHTLNPHPIHWADIFDMVADAGYPTQKLSFNEWVEAIEERANPDNNPLYPLLPFFHINFAARMLGIADDSHYDALGTTTIREGLDGSSIQCPPIDNHLISTFLNEFVRTKRLQAPLNGTNIAVEKVNAVNA